MLHGSPDVVPGLTELVEGHRSGAPSIDDVRGLTWHVTARGYHLLLGLRRHRDWTAVRPRAFAAALDGLRRGFRIVVADVDADLEGEQATGSVDVEERNAIARTTISAADLVLVVGQPGLKGLHSHLRTTRAVLAHGVPGDRLLPVINRSPKGPRARAELTAAFGTLLGGDGAGVPSPLHVAGAPAPRRGPPRRRPVPRRLDRPGRDERPGGPRSRGGAGRRGRGAGPRTRPARLARPLDRRRGPIDAVTPAAPSERVEDQLPRRQAVLAPAVRGHEALVGRAAHAVGPPLRQRVRRRAVPIRCCARTRRARWRSPGAPPASSSRAASCQGSRSTWSG